MATTTLLQVGCQRNHATSAGPRDQKLRSGPQLADALRGAVAFDFHGESPCQVWLVEKHS